MTHAQRGKQRMLWRHAGALDGSGVVRGGCLEEAPYEGNSGGWLGKERRKELLCREQAWPASLAGTQTLKLG